MIPALCLVIVALIVLAAELERRRHRWQRRADHWFTVASEAEWEAERLRRLVSPNAVSYGTLSQLMPRVVEEADRG
jgi:hypothetical protein